MEPKHVVVALVILNLIFLLIFFLLTSTSIFDKWSLNKVSQKICVEEQADGEKVFVICPEYSNQ